jgi:hypothetical protein
MNINIWTPTANSQIKSAELIPEEEFAAVHDMLSKIKVRLVSSAPRGGFGTHRSMTFGLTRHRFKGRELRPSWASLKYPQIHAEVFRLGRAFCPHPFTSVHLNNNVICPPHVDGNNNGESTVLSFGEYTGCNLVVEGIEYDARYRPLTFDGNVLKHWNTPNLVGNKYSLVFFNMYD